ncbi:MAG: hypothetical protein JW726_04580 [Anaerolineales bacterium]|nr:hypothetical protein [Anaerolineales bacterium]
MPNPALLLKRLDEIADALRRSPHGIALIGLGSVGRELERLDSYSDLDFFAIVEPGNKQAYIDDLGWLASICPVAYAFRNTQDGYKLLFADGIFCEFAVFEPQELGGIPFAPGRIVWKRADAPDTLCEPKIASSTRAASSLDWLLGEALTNLYVGLCRYQRGEVLSAQRFIQQHAVDRWIELAEQMEKPAQPLADPFASERRFEQRFPELAACLGDFIQGYAGVPASARAILAHLEQRFAVNPALKDAILALCDEK